MAEVISIPKRGAPAGFISLEGNTSPASPIEVAATEHKESYFLPTPLPLVTEPLTAAVSEQVAAPVEEKKTVERDPIIAESPRNSSIAGLKSELDVLEQSLTALEAEVAQINKERERVSSLTVRLQNLASNLRQ